jgi:hypothetical protein
MAAVPRGMVEAGAEGDAGRGVIDGEAGAAFAILVRSFVNLLRAGFLAAFRWRMTVAFSPSPRTKVAVMIGVLAGAAVAYGHDTESPPAAPRRRAALPFAKS